MLEKNIIFPSGCFIGGSHDTCTRLYGYVHRVKDRICIIHSFVNFQISPMQDIGYLCVCSSSECPIQSSEQSDNCLEPNKICLNYYLRDRDIKLENYDGFHSKIWFVECQTERNLNSLRCKIRDIRNSQPGIVLHSKIGYILCSIEIWASIELLYLWNRRGVVTTIKRCLEKLSTLCPNINMPKCPLSLMVSSLLTRAMLIKDLQKECTTMTPLERADYEDNLRLRCTIEAVVQVFGIVLIFVIYKFFMASISSALAPIRLLTEMERRLSAHLLAHPLGIKLHQTTQDLLWRGVVGMISNNWFNLWKRLLESVVAGKAMMGVLILVTVLGGSRSALHLLLDMISVMSLNIYAYNVIGKFLIHCLVKASILCWRPIGNNHIQILADRFSSDLHFVTGVFVVVSALCLGILTFIAPSAIAFYLVISIFDLIRAIVPYGITKITPYARSFTLWTLGFPTMRNECSQYTLSNPLIEQYKSIVSIIYDVKELPNTQKENITSQPESKPFLWNVTITRIEVTKLLPISNHTDALLIEIS